MLTFTFKTGLFNSEVELFYEEKKEERRICREVLFILITKSEKGIEWSIGGDT